jgi:alkanesulfonate monooxygenase
VGRAAGRDRGADRVGAGRGRSPGAPPTEPPRISVSVRPILGRTEEEAWDRAHSILDTINSRGAAGSFVGSRRATLPLGPDAQPQNTGSQRLLAAAAKGELHDRALWTPTAKATGAAGNSTALVGTPETVAQALLDYVDIGVTTLLIRGYDPLEDVIDYGRELLPLVRAEVARRDAGTAPATGSGPAVVAAGAR